MRVLLIALLVLTLAACASPAPTLSPSLVPSASGASPSGASPSTASPSTASPSAEGATSIPLVTSAVARDDRFTLRIEIGKERYAANEKIEVRTTYTFLGPEGRVTAWGSGSGLVIVALDQLDGRLHPGGGGDDSCTPYDLVRGVPNVVPYVKSGGWDATDPNAAWYEGFFKDPELRLPAGTWRLTAHLDAIAGAACEGDRHELDAAVTLQVTG